MGTLKWEQQNLNYRSESVIFFFEGSVLFFLMILIPQKLNVTQSLGKGKRRQSALIQFN